MLRIKSGVKMVDIKPQIVLAINIAETVYRYFDVDLVITSLTDGKHSKNSLHYVGEAVDLRTYNVAEDDLMPLFKKLRSALGENYDVVLEKTHIHVEYDPD